MSKPLIVSIPHDLGKQEATRRLQTGMGQVRSQFGDTLTLLEDRWTGDHMDFRVGAMGQTVSGSIDVSEDNVRLEVQLPWILSIFAEKAKALIQRQGTLMLEKK